MMILPSDAPLRFIARLPYRFSPLFLFIVLVIFPSSLWACRYNVRDVGFVQFGPAPYHLYGFITDRIPSDEADTIQQIAFAALLDSNVDLQIVNIDRETDPSVLAYLPSSSSQKFPLWTLVSPEGDSYPIPESTESKPLKEAVWETVDRLISSPMRETIAQNAIRTYGVLLMVEGMDTKENQRVKQVIEDVIAQVDSNLSALPKLVDHPPVLQVLARKDFDSESVLLWSLGIDPNDTSPQVAVIYGRSRRVGSLLDGNEIATSDLSSLVSVIGLSCECGLDRSWMMGTMIPFRWTNEYREEAAQRLGFDPDSPMVKTEISQIMSTSASRQPNGSRGSADLLMGYGEITLDFDTPESGNSEEMAIEDQTGESTKNRDFASSTTSDPETILALNTTDAQTRSPSSMQEKGFEVPQSSHYWGIFVIIFGLLIVSLSGGFLILWKAKG